MFIIIVAALSLYFYLSCLFENSERKMSEDVTENTSDNLVPSIFVDKNLLECTTNSNNKDTSKYFIIGDKIFEDELRMPDNNYVQFQMFATKRCEMAKNFFFGNQDDEEYCWTPDESSDDEVSTNEPLDLHMQTTSHGVIIDSNVYLSHYQWNTIMIEDDIAQCAMCNVHMVLDWVPEHLACDDHKRKLNCYKPLAKFDLSVTRKIRNSYHCAVCNTTFDSDKVNSHNDSEEHTNNLLSAINKVSDVINIDSFDNSNNNDDHRNRNNNIKHKDNYSFNGMKFSDGDDGDSEDNCDNDSNNPEWPVDDFHMPGPSYTDMVKKPALALPEYLDIVVNDRSVRVKFNSWHMLITPKQNRFYCMLCKDYDFISRRAQHCGAPDHLGYLNSCKLVAKFEKHLVRQVDHLFHCGHCNSLQLAHDIEDHLESKHPQKTRMLSGSSSASDPQRNNDDTLTKTVVQSTVTQSNDSNSNDNVLSKSNAGIRNNDTNGNGNNNHPIMGLHVVLNIFNCQMKVPLLNYNFLQINAGYYNCSLCQCVGPKELVMAHIMQSVIHIQLMQSVPYIVQFIYNLIRPIRGNMHCTLCNIFVPPTMIYLHVQESSHRNQLHKALDVTTVTANDKNQTASTNNEENRSNEKLSIFEYGNNDIWPALGFKNNDNATSTSDSALVTDAKSIKDLSAFEANDGAAATEEDILNDFIELIIDLDSYVYVKIAKVYLKIDVMSYNTLVVVGDGYSRYCFVCSTKIGFEKLKKHVNGLGHKKNLSECRYVDLYEGSLLRQMHSLYHCGTCNVLLTRKTMKYHVAWSTHTEEWETAKSVPKNARKNAIKSGISLIVATPQKETLYLQEDLPKCKVLYKVRVTQNDRKHKVVMINDDVFKISFDHWHGVATRAKTVLTCVICQSDIADVTRHTGTRSHLECLNKPFKGGYLGELLREINKTSLHCIPCNVEVANTNQVVLKHVSGKKHKKMYQAIIEFSTKSDNYVDCEDDILQL